MFMFSVYTLCNTGRIKLSFGRITASIHPEDVHELNHED